MAPTESKKTGNLEDCDLFVPCVEGWHVVAEANRIFGFDGWDRETVSSNCVWTKQNGLRFSACYVTRVRITVRAGDERFLREGCGAGESNA